MKAPKTLDENGKLMAGLLPSDPADGCDPMPRGSGAVPAGEPSNDSEIGTAPAEIVKRWTADGALVRVPTGFAALDGASRGGLPVPWRLTINGAPGAGKTALANALARRLLVGAGFFVAVHAVDEDEDDVFARHAQMAGFTIAQCEDRDPRTLLEMADALGALPMRFYAGEQTIEAVTADGAARAAALGLRFAYVADSIQTIRASAALTADTPRTIVEANVQAIRVATARHKMLAIVTSEANRNSYRQDDSAETTNDLASSKESSAIEYSAQTLLVVRTPKGHPDCVHVSVPKNRKGRAKFDFYLHLDRERHALTDCSDPTSLDDLGAAEQRAETKRKAAKGEIAADSAALAKVMRGAPGMGLRALRAELGASAHKWGVERFDAALVSLKRGFRGERAVDRALVNGALPKGAASAWWLERVSPGEVDE